MRIYCFYQSNIFQFELKDMKRRQDEDIMRMDIIEKQKEQEKAK